MTKKKPILELTGANGNAFAVIGLACKAARKAGWSGNKISKMKDEAMSGDYNHLLQAMFNYFDVL